MTLPSDEIPDTSSFSCMTLINPVSIFVFPVSCPALLLCCFRRGLGVVWTCGVGVVVAFGGNRNSIRNYTQTREIFIDILNQKKKITNYTL